MSCYSPDSPVVPRPYQEKAIEAILAARRSGLERALITMPTGTGKTNVFAWLPERMELSRPTLVLAHRDELIRQAADRFVSLAPGLRIGIEKAHEKAPADSDVVIASVQSIGRRGSRRLSWLELIGPELIICDEAHHAPADTYTDIFKRFGAFDGRAFLVGVTATPHRTDARGLGQIFQEEVYRYELRDAMRDAWLCPIRGYRVVTDTDISGVKTSQGDFVVGELSRAVNNAQRTAQAIRHWREIAAGRRTLAFCVDVAHAHAAAQQFREAGISAEALDGSMPLEQRRAILDRLRSGETRVATNCAVLTEGFDCPEVAAILMLRPTQSPVLYTQQAGRGTRLAPGKEDLLLIDVVDNCRRSSLVTAPALLGLPEMDLEGHSLAEAADLVERLGAGAAELPDAGLTFDDLRTRLERYEIFGPLELPEEMQETQLAWTALPRGAYLSGGDGRVARLNQDMLGVYRLEIRDSEGTETIRLEPSLPASVGKADEILLKAWSDATSLISRTSCWRREPATEKQRDLLRRKGVPLHLLAALTKGEGCLLIGRLLAK
jgi:ATP-dependent helicase IRC3